MAPQKYFTYTQLPPSTNTTRVVNLLPGTRPAPIQCEINVIGLDEPPPYCALSYVWGERSEDYWIFIDQEHICVTPSLYNNLQHLRSNEETRTFWIDAICINQLDNTEKSSQVRKMQEIYGRSSEILIWLGPEEEGSASAMALASRIAAYWSDQGLDPSDAESDFRKKSAADLSTLLGQSTYDPAPVEAFRRLINRGWFERVWTVQEAAAPAKTKTVQCGDSTIDWASFITAAKFLAHAIIRPDLKMYFPIANPLRSNSLPGLFNLDHLQRFIESGRHQTDLLGILANYRCYKATDPRDKVYALLGLVTETLTDISVCDYFLDTPTVYLQVAKQCILHRGSLECLGYCNPSLRNSDLPSWVPDWRYPSARHPLAKWSKHKPYFGDPDLVDKRIYSSSADSTSQKRHLSFSHSQNPKLVNEGFCIGKVLTAGLPFYQDATTQGFESDVLRGWEPENLQILYRPTGETNLEAFSHTIVADVAKKGPLRERGFAVDWGFWRSVKDFAQPPTSPQLRAEWGSLLFAAVGKSLVFSNNGHMCLAPGETRPGDQICILFGGHVFYILRPAGECWSFIGECYVHGLMDGEAMSLLANGTYELQDFIIA